MKTIVVAYDKSRGIGAHNGLPWGKDMPADLRHFRDLTMGGSIIMGRNTFESIGKPLVGRENIVVTHRQLDDSGVVVAESLSEAYKAAHGNQFIIGGASIYEQAMPDVDVIYATEIQNEFSDVDTYFPVLDETWKERARESHLPDEKNRYAYDFVTYVRVPK